MSAPEMVIMFVFTLVTGFVIGLFFCQRLVEHSGDVLREAQRNLRKAEFISKDTDLKIEQCQILAAERRRSLDA